MHARGQNCAVPDEQERSARQFCPPYAMTLLAQ
jgi:hypothetical protein